MRSICLPRSRRKRKQFRIERALWKLLQTKYNAFENSEEKNVTTFSNTEDCPRGMPQYEQPSFPSTKQKQLYCSSSSTCKDQYECSAAGTLQFCCPKISTVIFKFSSTQSYWNSDSYSVYMLKARRSGLSTWCNTSNQLWSRIFRRQQLNLPQVTKNILYII